MDDAGPSRPESGAVRCESFRTPVIKCDASVTFLPAWFYAGPDPVPCFAFSETLARETAHSCCAARKATALHNWHTRLISCAALKCIFIVVPL